MNKPYSPFYFLLTLALFAAFGQYSAPAIAALCPTTISGNIPGCELPAELVTVTSTGRIDETVSNNISSQGISNSGIIDGTSTLGILNAGVMAILKNDGQITAITNPIENDGVIKNLTNSGLIYAPWDYAIVNWGEIDSLTNTGRIISNAYGGIANSGQIGILNNSNGLISGLNAGVSNAGGGIINTLINSGVISANNPVDNHTLHVVGLVNDGLIQTIQNSGTISAVNYYPSDVALGIYNQGSIYTLNNFVSGVISGTNEGAQAARGIDNSGGTIRDLNNSGVIAAKSVSGSSSGIYNYGLITNLNNNGIIRATALGGDAIGIYNDGGEITAIANNGAIYGGTSGVGYSVGIYNNSGRITTLTNTQGGNSASALTTALTYEGKLPTNYNIGIVSPTHYGQLAVSNPVDAITNFGIYGSPFLTARTYASVLSGTALPTGVSSGSYDNMTWSLVANGVDTYDLTFTGASLMGTQQSLVNTANALAPIYTLQNSVLANSFAYDCTEFGINNICVSAGGRNTAVSAANGLNNTSALLIGAYRPHPNYRVGAYVDQNLSVSNAGSTVNLGNNTPLIGLFGAWNERLDGTGTEVKVSAAYGQKNATITRQVVGLSEPGSGSSQLHSQGAQVTAKYGFGVVENMIVSPYVGMRYTQNNMGGYTEGASSSVTAPLTYAALNTNATTALAGVGVSYKVVPQLTTFASAGVETDTNTQNGTYSATGINGLTPVNFNPNPVKTRPTATVGAYYDIVKNQRLGITGIYRQEPFQSVSTTTVMATYTVGL